MPPSLEACIVYLLPFWKVDLPTLVLLLYCSPVPLLYVCQAMPLVRQWQQALGEHLQLISHNTHLTLLGALDTPPCTNNVTNIQQVFEGSKAARLAGLQTRLVHIELRGRGK